MNISEIYTGQPDASDEVDVDGYEKLISSLVLPPNFDFNDLVYGDKYFIKGFKGTGKTALLYYLESKLKEIDDQAFVYIF